MNILFATRPYEAPRQEGGQTYLYDIYDALIELGYPAFAFSSSSFCGKQLIHAFSSPKWSLQRKLELTINLARYSGGFNIVHTAHVPTSQNASIFKLLKRIHPTTRFVQTITSLNKTAGIEKLLWGDHVICFSSQIYDVVSSRNDNVSLINPYASPKRLISQTDTLSNDLISSHAPVFIFPGEFQRLGLTPEKYAFFNNILKHYQKSLIIFACRFDDNNIANNIINSCDSSSRKRILNIGRTEKIISYLNNADLVIYPAFNMQGKFNPPYVLLESLALGKPVLTTDKVHFSNEHQLSMRIETINSESDKYSVIDKIESLLKSPTTKNNYENSFDSMIQNHISVYESLL